MFKCEHAIKHSDSQFCDLQDQITILKSQYYLKEAEERFFQNKIDEQNNVIKVQSEIIANLKNIIRNNCKQFELIDKLPNYNHQEFGG